jgi:hypothetical protein
MDKLHRCPRCAARRVEDHQFCSKCGYDYSLGLGPSRHTRVAVHVQDEPVLRRGEVVASPGPSPLARDRAYLGVPPRDIDTTDLRRDVARLALARESIRVRSRIGAVIGMFLGLLVGAVAAQIFMKVNPLLPLVILIAFVWLGGWIGSWLVVRSLAE